MKMPIYKKNPILLLNCKDEDQEVEQRSTKRPTIIRAYEN